MTQKELLEKAEIVKWDEIDNVPLLTGIFIIQQRKLHDSGYRMMYVIGHTEDFKYYLLATYSDVIVFTSFWSKIKLEDLHLDINRHGIIHVWSKNKLKLTTALSNCDFDILG